MQVYLRTYPYTMFLLSANISSSFQRLHIPEVHFIPSLSQKPNEMNMQFASIRFFNKWGIIILNWFVTGTSVSFQIKSCVNKYTQSRHHRKRWGQIHIQEQSSSFVNDLKNSVIKLWINHQSNPYRPSIKTKTWRILHWLWMHLRSNPWRNVISYNIHQFISPHLYF